MSQQSETTQRRKQAAARGQVSLLVLLLVLLAYLLRSPWAGPAKLGPVGLAAVVLLAVGQCGRALLNRFMPSGFLLLTWIEQLPMGVGLGLLVLGNVVFLLAALHLLNPVAIAAVVGVMGVGGWAWLHRKPLPPRSSALGSLWTLVWHHAPHPALGVAVLALLMLGLLGALAPSLYYDVLVYHYALPALYLREGGLVPVPTLVHSNFPLLLEMVSTVGIAFDASGVAANLLNLALGLCMFVSIADTGRRLLGEAAGWRAMFLCMACPALFSVAVLPTSDVGVAAFGALAANALVRYAEMGERAWLILAGLLVGGTLASKNVAVVNIYLLFVLLLVWIEAQAQGRGLWSRVVNVGMGVAVPALVNVPTLFKNLLFTGNPFLPALHNVMGGRGWSAQQAALLARDAHQAPLTVEHWMRLPQVLVEEFIGPSSALDGTCVGVLPTMMVMIALLMNGPSANRVRALLGLFVVQVLVWYATFVQSRFLGPAAITMGLVGGWAWWRINLSLLGQWRVLLGAVAAVAIVVAGVCNYGTVAAWQGNFIPVALGLEDEDRYIGEHLDYRHALAEARKVITPGEKVLMLGEARSFHFDVPSMLTGPLDVSPMRAAMDGAQEPEEVEQRLRAMGIGAILFRPHELARLASFSPTWKLDDAEQEMLTRVLKERSRLVFQTPRGGTLLFKLGSGGE